MATLSRPCDGCGGAVPRTKPTGVIPPYCGDDCKPRCSVEGCDGPSRKRGWCASHYAQQRKTGQPPTPFKYKWGALDACRVCEKPTGNGSRAFCSQACGVLWRAYAGEVPTHRTCVGCGVSIDLRVRGKGGQRVKASVKFCRRCRNDYDKYKMTAAQLAQRDGTDCGICGYPVDMTLRRSDPDGQFCASVDHIIPRSRGGSHEPENLQLAHLWCNQVKSDRAA